MSAIVVEKTLSTKKDWRRDTNRYATFMFVMSDLHHVEWRDNEVVVRGSEGAVEAFKTTLNEIEKTCG